MEERVKALEERMEILEAGEIAYQHRITEWADSLTSHMDEQASGVIKVSLGNIQTMKNIIKDLQEHFESHNLDKKSQYASKRKPNTNISKLENIYKGRGGEDEYIGRGDVTDGKV